MPIVNDDGLSTHARFRAGRMLWRWSTRRDGPVIVCKCEWGSGRGDRIRTCDFSLPKRALYQAELRPDSEEAEIIPHFVHPSCEGEPECENRGA